MGAVHPRGFRIARVLRVAWLNAAIFVTLVAGIELLALTYYSLKAAVVKRDESALAAREMPDDAYPDKSWLEAYYREFDGPGLALRWSPFVYWRRVPSAGAFITVDDAGIRKTWNQTPQDGGDTPSALRVAIFGGSATWGTGARDDFTIPSHLSKILAREYPHRFQVTNYGEIGYVSTQSVVALIREIQAGRIPDIVIFYDGYNDSFSAYQNGVAGLPQNEANRASEFNLLNSSRSIAFFKEILRRTNSYALITDIRAGLRGPAAAGPAGRPLEGGAPTIAQDVVDVYGKNIDIVTSMAATWHFAPRFYWQPTVFTKPEKTDYERKGESAAGDFAGFYRLTMTTLARAALRGTHTDFRDLSDIFDADPRTSFVDDVHTTEVANEKIATRIAADLKDVLAERAASRRR